MPIGRVCGHRVIVGEIDKDNTASTGVPISFKRTVDMFVVKTVPKEKYGIGV